MSKQVEELLEVFESLSSEEKQVVTMEVLRRTRKPPFASEPMTAEEGGRAHFSPLDEEEKSAPSQ